MRARHFLAVLLLAFVPVVYATIFGSVTGLIHDPQHRPVQNAQIVIHSGSSDWTETTATDSSGEFRFDNVPLGDYSVTVTTSGFAEIEQKLTVSSSREARLHFSLTVAQAKETVEVRDIASTVDPQSSTTSSVVSRQQITQTPGADQTNSLAMITNYVPSAVMVHDQLHIRGGHQVSWLLDGVPVPNTNIASNVGPQFDPKDIASIEVQRGGFSAEYGDRTYSVFNVITRSGFERNNQAELVTSYGSFNQTNDQFSIGSHTDRFAYYASVNGYRTDLGLETPTAEALHDQSAGAGGYLSLIFNRTPADQFRLALSSRADHYQVPNSADDQSAGIRDVDDETDRFANLSWTHTASNGVVFTLAPFYHFN